VEINDYISKIKKLNACSKTIKAAHGYKTSQELWGDCKRGDWMLWLIGKLSGEPESEKRKKLVLTACKCARLSLKYVEKDETRPLQAIEIAEKWARGEASIKQVRDAVYAASSADAADAADAAAYAADAAAYFAASAAYAAYAAAYAAASAADAAYAAAYAADAADAADAEKETLAKCADIVRKDYPSVDLLFEEKPDA